MQDQLIFFIDFIGGDGTENPGSVIFVGIS
jgi:hypothetical protein